MNPVDLRLYGLVGSPGHRDPAALAAQAAKGGATLVQLRDKSADTRALIETAKAIKAAIAPYGVPLLINDRVDVAIAAKADGVHLGQSDMPVEAARDMLGPEAIIGLTIKNADHVAKAPVDLLDYAAVGGVFETISKDNPDPPVGLDGLQALSNALRQRRSGLPVVAIAGIDEVKARSVINAGADGISVISTLFDQGDVEARAGILRAAVDGALEEKVRAS